MLSLLYRDPNAIILYVTKRWSNPGVRTEGNIRKWLKIINYHTAKSDVIENESILQKGMRIKLEMMAFIQVQ